MNINDYQPLETYSRDTAERPRPDALATISAGTKENGIPKVSRTGQIILHDPEGRAPGLAQALKAEGGKRLTIAFPVNDPRLFIQERFVNYSATALLAYGDTEQIVVLDAKSETRHVLTPEMPEFEVALRACKVARSVYFVLAEWSPHGDPNGEPQMVFPDGLGFYRLRFTSHNSIRSILATLRDVSRFTGGRIAGIPFTLSLDYRDVADAKGIRHKAPIWTIVMRPPETLRLSSRNFAALTEKALTQGRALMLPPPSTESLALAITEGPELDLDAEVIEPSELEAEHLAAGGRCDKDFWLRTWFGRVKGTIYEDPEKRAAFIADYTGEDTDSLADFLEEATEAEAAEMIAAMLRSLEVPEDHHHDPRPLTPNERQLVIAKGKEAEALLWPAKATPPPQPSQPLSEKPATLIRPAVKPNPSMVDTRPHELAEAIRKDTKVFGTWGQPANELQLGALTVHLKERVEEVTKAIYGDPNISGGRAAAILGKLGGTSEKQKATVNLLFRIADEAQTREGQGDGNQEADLFHPEGVGELDEGDEAERP